MSEEQLKQLNQRLLEAEKLLDKADITIPFLSLIFKKDREIASWRKQYQKYLKTYKK